VEYSFSKIHSTLKRKLRKLGRSGLWSGFLDFQSIVRKDLLRYLIFIGLVLAILSYKEQVSRFTGIQGLDANLLSATVIFFFIDIPLTYSRRKRERSNVKKNQIIIDHYLDQISKDLFSILFYYIYIPSQASIKSSYYLKDIEKGLEKVDLISASRFYVNVTFRYDDGLKTQTIHLDSKMPIREGRDIRKGFGIKKFEISGNTISIEKEKTYTVSLGRFKEDVTKVRDELINFADKNSPILTTEQINHIYQLLIKINEVLYGLSYIIPLNEKKFQYGLDILRFVNYLTELSKYYIPVRKLVSEHYLGIEFGAEFPKGLKLFIDPNTVRDFNVEELILQKSDEEKNTV